MFQRACSIVREASYGILCHSEFSEHKIADCGSGFMIAPGVIATVAHALHQNGDISQELHHTFEVIRSPDVGEDMLFAYLVAEDIHRDLALIRVEHPRNINQVSLVENKVNSGTSCGSLGFSLSTVDFNPDGLHFTLIERFQGAHVSAYMSESIIGRDLEWYEMDSQMYSGSSGCPVFLVDGRIFGIQSNTLTSDKTSSDESKRLAIARLVPSTEIIKFARANNVII